MRTVEFFELQLRMGQRAYLPLVSGQLAAFAWTHPEIARAYRVGQIHFAHDPPDQIEQECSPDIDVAAFSVSLWNEQLSLEMARRVRTRHPHALIVFGGCQMPFDARDYLIAHHEVDVCTRGEGEETFRYLLRARANGQHYTTIPNCTVGHVVTPHRDGPKDLDVFPSPYLNGFYDPLLAEHPEIEWQSI